ncbi:MAG: hypothetical protein M3238_03860, partial [Actinomycetota bacterium]|nr:hypothetical protein [Actinomycetota bacterium]
MSETLSERKLWLAAAAALVLALGFDLATGDVDEPSSEIVATGDLLETRAAFCPPPFHQDRATTVVA